MNQLKELKIFVTDIIQNVTLEQSLLIQRILNKIYDMEKCNETSYVMDGRSLLVKPDGEIIFNSTTDDERNNYGSWVLRYSYFYKFLNNGDLCYTLLYIKECMKIDLNDCLNYLPNKDEIFEQIIDEVIRKNFISCTSGT